MQFPSWPYPDGPARSGIWGEITSGENYCEEDYIITHLFAEFANTTTNLAYLIYAAYGITQSYKYPDFWKRAFPYLGIAGVGICSAAFHGTVKLWAQWADDLSMFFAVGIVMYQVYAFGHDTAYHIKVGTLLFSVMTAIAVYHVNVDTSTVHQMAFVIMVLVVAHKVRALTRERVQNKNVRRKMAIQARSGTLGLLFAWFLWGLDNIFCDWFRQTRRQIGLPWGHLLELHGWWHVITAIAVYQYFVLTELLTSEGSIEENIRKAGRSAWPVSTGLIDELNNPLDNKSR